MLDGFGARNTTIVLFSEVIIKDRPATMVQTLPVPRVYSTIDKKSMASKTGLSK